MAEPLWSLEDIANGTISDIWAVSQVLIEFTEFMVEYGAYQDEWDLGNFYTSGVIIG